MLKALNTFLSTVTRDGISVRTPHFHLFLRDSNTQIIEDIPNAIDMKTNITSPDDNIFFNQTIAFSIGYALGSWLRSFHVWARESTQASLNNEIGGNTEMRKLKFMINYENFIHILEDHFPDIIEGYERTFAAVKDLASKEFEKSPEGEHADNWGIIHGDFWSGK
jgi:hypothetical protein